MISIKKPTEILIEMVLTLEMVLLSRCLVPALHRFAGGQSKHSISITFLLLDVRTVCGAS